QAPRPYGLLLAVDQRDDDDRDEHRKFHADLDVVDLVAEWVLQSDERDARDQHRPHSVHHRRKHPALAFAHRLDLIDHTTAQSDDADDVQGEDDVLENLHVLILPTACRIRRTWLTVARPSIVD